jgi:hypothetical protein
MPITLKIIGGIMAGREFVFDGPDLFLFGRATDCHCAIPADNYLSRHHFLLEVNPPDCQLKDLGSLNGTYVNNIKYGGRESAEPPEFEAAIGRAVGVRLKNGDIIKAGKIEIQVMIETEESPVLCVKCKAVIPEEEKDRWAFPGGAYLCGKCREVSARPVAAAPRSGQINMEELLRALFGAAGSGQDCPRIPGYEVLRRLGRGGFGEVYLVKRERDGKQLALKVMLSRRQDVGGKGRHAAYLARPARWPLPGGRYLATGPRFLGLKGQVHQPGGVACQVADRGIHLGEGDFHGRSPWAC